jgi:hypothetical protein
MPTSSMDPAPSSKDAPLSVLDSRVLKNVRVSSPQAKASSTKDGSPASIPRPIACDATGIASDSRTRASLAKSLVSLMMWRTIILDGAPIVMTP